MTEQKETFASRLFDNQMEGMKLDDELSNHINRILFDIDTSDSSDLIDWIEYFEDITYDYYDHSFELKGCSDEAYEKLVNLTQAQKQEFANLGFAQCWFCFKNPICINRQNKNELYHNFRSVQDGQVISYDQTRGIAIVKNLYSEDCIELHAGAFFSGLPARLPMINDKVRIKIVADVAVSAHLIKENNNL